ncbi:hypothetical protein MLD38_014440 [Melastoma candidum]|uniref:Uncharacterized protein n=1 Tax=Melastoma candidum TaxID=119954 RepID=A0ACB9RCR6_9MYRT|nr:hypothetical protein MLD38_014440 [Melastoma candidum]
MWPSSFHFHWRLPHPTLSSNDRLANFRLLGDGYEVNVVWSESRRNLAGEGSEGNSSVVLADENTRRRDPRTTSIITLADGTSATIITGLGRFHRYPVLRDRCSLVHYIRDFFRGKFHSSTLDTLVYIVNQANPRILRMCRSTSAAKQIGVGSFSLPGNVWNNIDELETKINSSADTLFDKTPRNSRNIQGGLDSIRLESLRRRDCSALSTLSLRIRVLRWMTITNVSNRSFPPIPTFCSPLNADLTNRQCASGEVDFNKGNSDPSARTTAPVSVDITSGCNIELVLVSAPSLIFWVIYAQERRHSVYAMHLM